MYMSSRILAFCNPTLPAFQLSFQNLISEHIIPMADLYPICLLPNTHTHAHTHTYTYIHACTHKHTHISSQSSPVCTQRMHKQTNVCTSLSCLRLHLFINLSSVKSFLLSVSGERQYLLESVNHLSVTLTLLVFRYYFVQQCLYYLKMSAFSFSSCV